MPGSACPTTTPSGTASSSPAACSTGSPCCCTSSPARIRSRMPKEKVEKNLFKAVDSPWLVPDDGSFKVKKARTAPPKDALDKAGSKKALDELTARLDTLQHILY